MSDTKPKGFSIDSNDSCFVNTSPTGKSLTKPIRIGLHQKNIEQGIFNKKDLKEIGNDITNEINELLDNRQFRNKGRSPDNNRIKIGHTSFDKKKNEENQNNDDILKCSKMKLDTPRSNSYTPQENTFIKNLKDGILKKNFDVSKLVYDNSPYPHHSKTTCFKI